jgi:hypothetical protein
MTRYGFAIILFASLAFAGYARAQNPAAPGSNDAVQPGTLLASSSVIQVLSPKVGERISSSVVNLRFQSSESAAPSQTYRVQLDSADPIETSATEYTFTSVAPGDHVLSVVVVDANHTPLAGSQTQVTFTTLANGATPSQRTGALAPPPVRKAKLELPSGDQLPGAGGELPLLSLIGFGVLVGGVISAMRTRK